MSSLLLTARKGLQQSAALSLQRQRRSLGHTVRIIVKEELPHGKAYKGDVIHVKAGYARNFLIPQKKAVYATRQNFEKLGMKDPDQETLEERKARLEREALATDDEDMKAADLLRYYLRNKVVSIAKVSCILRRM